MSKLSHRSKAWRILRLQRIQAANWKCERCGRAGRLEVHHIKPVHRGGDNHPDNLEVLCRRCHLSEHDVNGLTAQRREWEYELRDL